MLICAALANKSCTIICRGINRDMEATAACLNALGANIVYADGKFNVDPISEVKKGALLDCGESGSTLRFMLPVAAALGADAVFTGQGRLPQRPLSPLYEEMTAHGVNMSENGHMPLSCHGTLPAATYTIDGGVSSQFISGLLMALPLSGGDCTINITGKLESASYIGLTLNALKQFGIEVQATGQGYRIPGGQRYATPDGPVAVEGDWSAAAFWLTAGAAGAKQVSCTGLDYEHSAQGDRRIVDVLRQQVVKRMPAGNRDHAGLHRMGAVRRRRHFRFAADRLRSMHLAADRRFRTLGPPIRHHAVAHRIVPAGLRRQLTADRTGCDLHQAVICRVSVQNILVRQSLVNLGHIGLPQGRSRT